MKKVIFIFGMGLLALTSANAKSGKTDNSKTTEAVATPAETKTADATAYYQYNGPANPTQAQLENASNYSNTVVSNPNDLCDISGDQGCAAQFTVGTSGHTGSPSDIRTRD